MLTLLVLAILLGIGTVIKMIIWCIETWKQANEEERKLKRFEDFSKMMAQTNLKLGN